MINSCIFFIKKTPSFLYFLAILLATFASVLVGATPIETGIPVHFPTLVLKSMKIDLISLLLSSLKMLHL